MQPICWIAHILGIQLMYSYYIQIYSKAMYNNNNNYWGLAPIAFNHAYKKTNLKIMSKPLWNIQNL